MEKIKVVFFLSFILLSHCKKDSQENYFTYDGKTFSIAGVKLNKLGGDGSDGYLYDLKFYSKGITFEPGHDNPLGSGELLSFLVSSSTPDLKSRIYVYNVTSIPFAIGTYSGCWFQHNLIVSEGSCEIIELYTGTLNIVSTGSSEYIIFINVNTRSGKPITGYYRGFIT